MNARHNKFELTLEGRQVQEVVTGLFHTLLFYRSTGKYHFNENGSSYRIGTIGFEDVACDFIDFTYVRCSSDELNRDLNKDVSGFSNALRNAEADGSGGAREGQIQLEFYQRKKKSRWTLFEENIPWEVWMLKVNIVKLPNEAERQKQRCTASEELADAMFTVATSMNRNEYVPRTNRAEDLDLIFNTRYTDIQPYLFKVGYQTEFDAQSPTLQSTFKKMFRGTIADLL
ncbi:autophagy-related protein 101-like [Varroa jacobsoni]|uniref:Autophagy-related protein 101 n=1 Tax=Varroa destructor TaxID=109461 RepID=A0A7M7JX59_VARDE|nr:autophagy-related protein 101-like [Varroa destructor]XP_022658169.1 autophagy-related protein 101-like [Varroa destructor]XP_022689624.1 autophagy-related protein 101-like [Varroa jacobsoni]